MSSFFLIKGTDPHGSERVELSPEMIVGRSEDCDLRVQEGHPSRRHARLQVADGKLWVEDLGSANGTFVNDRQITGRTELAPGDRLAFDLATFVVAAPDAADEATVVRRAPPAGDATVVRPAPAAADPATPAPAPTPEATPAAGSPPDSAPPAPETGKGHVPRSWADPDFQGQGTRVLTREELAAMAGGSGSATAAGHVDGPHLTVLSGKSAGAVLAFDPSAQSWSIGSDEARDLRLTDEGISAFHAKISRDGTRWRIIDQMSANGTWVNGDKVTVSYLGNGDRIRFGQVECAVQLTGGGRGAGGKPVGSAGIRTWIIAAAAAVVTLGVLAVMSWLG